MTRNFVQNASPVLGNLILFTICTWKILEAGVGTSTRVDGKGHLFLDKFVTSNRRGVLTEACADGKLTPIFGCRQPAPVAARRRRGFAAAHMLELQIRITPRAFWSVCRECCVLSGRGFCDGSLSRLENSYRVCVSLSVISCDNNPLQLG